MKVGYDGLYERIILLPIFNKKQESLNDKKN